MIRNSPTQPGRYVGSSSEAREGVGGSSDAHMAIRWTSAVTSGKRDVKVIRNEHEAAAVTHMLNQLARHGDCLLHIEQRV